MTPEPASAPDTSETVRGGPVSPAERIVLVDIVRGAALFGILTANMRAFVAPLDAYDDIGALFPAKADVIAQAIVATFFQGKFISIFSFLFGLGFAIQLSRAEARGARFMGFYPRRLLALAVFGIIHGMLIWAGDVLLTYAFAGALLLFFRHRRQKTLLWWAGSIFALPFVGLSIFLAIFFSPLHQKWMDPKPPDVAKFHHVIDIYAHGTLRQIVAQNFVEWKAELPTTLFAIYALALFLLGLWVWRAGILQRLEALQPVFRRVAFWCIPLGLAGSAYTAVVYAVIPRGKISVPAIVANLLQLPSAHVLAAGYLSVIVLIFLSARGRRVLLPFAAVGRMALTNYLLQSVICTLFFYSTGTGWFGRIGPAAAFVPTIVLYCAQLVWSNWWLGRYRFGPMEWIWRGLTYGRLPALRRSVGAAQALDAGALEAPPG